MSRPESAIEPNMDEILASIRKIIAEEPVDARPMPEPSAKSFFPVRNFVPAVSEPVHADGASVASVISSRDASNDGTVVLGSRSEGLEAELTIFDMETSGAPHEHSDREKSQVEGSRFIAGQHAGIDDDLADLLETPVSAVGYEVIDRSSVAVVEKEAAASSGAIQLKPFVENTEKDWTLVQELADGLSEEWSSAAEPQKQRAAPAVNGASFIWALKKPYFVPPGQVSQPAPGPSEADANTVSIAEPVAVAGTALNLAPQVALAEPGEAIAPVTAPPKKRTVSTNFKLAFPAAPAAAAVTAATPVETSGQQPLPPPEHDRINGDLSDLLIGIVNEPVSPQVLPTSRNATFAADSAAAAVSALDQLAAGLAASGAVFPNGAARPAKPADVRAELPPLQTGTAVSGKDDGPGNPVPSIQEILSVAKLLTSMLAALPGAEKTSGNDTANIGLLDDKVAGLLTPLLKQWLAENMPRIVEKALLFEVSSGGRPRI